MVYYKNTKIYTIRNHVNSKVFVASTTTRICEAFNAYKQTFKKGCMTSPLFKAFNELGLDKFYAQLEGKVQCSNKEEVIRHVNDMIRKYDSVQHGYNYVRCTAPIPQLFSDVVEEEQKEEDILMEQPQLADDEKAFLERYRWYYGEPSINLVSALTSANQQQVLS